MKTATNWYKMLCICLLTVFFAASGFAQGLQYSAQDGTYAAGRLEAQNIAKKFMPIFRSGQFTPASNNSLMNVAYDVYSVLDKSIGNLENDARNLESRIKAIEERLTRLQPGIGNAPMESDVANENRVNALIESKFKQLEVELQKSQDLPNVEGLEAEQKSIDQRIGMLQTQLSQLQDNPRRNASTNNAPFWLSAGFTALATIFFATK